MTERAKDPTMRFVLKAWTPARSFPFVIDVPISQIVAALADQCNVSVDELDKIFGGFKFTLTEVDDPMVRWQMSQETAPISRGATEGGVL